MNTSHTNAIMGAAARIVLLTAILLTSFASASAQDVHGQKSVGLKAGYVGENESAMAGMFFQYSFNKHVRIAPQLGIIFRNNDKDALTVDMDMQFPIPFGYGKANIYPLAGLAFESWTLHSPKSMTKDDSKDVNTHHNYLGANAGLGFDLKCGESLKLNIEAKYSFLKEFGGFFAYAGIAYIF